MNLWCGINSVSGVGSAHLQPSVRVCLVSLLGRASNTASTTFPERFFLSKENRTSRFLVLHWCVLVVMLNPFCRSQARKLQQASLVRNLCCILKTRSKVRNGKDRLRLQQGGGSKSELVYTLCARVHKIMYRVSMPLQ